MAHTRFSDEDAKLGEVRSIVELTEQVGSGAEVQTLCLILSHFRLYKTTSHFLVMRLWELMVEFRIGFKPRMIKK